MAFKPIDPKRDEFRRYLERSGIIESLTKLFVNLAKERPEDPMDYIRRNLGDSRQQADYMECLNIDLADARKEIQRLRDIISSIDPFALETQPNEEENNTETKCQSIEKNGDIDIKLDAKHSGQDKVVVKEEQTQNAENPVEGGDDNKPDTDLGAVSGEHVPESIANKPE